MKVPAGAFNKEKVKVLRTDISISGGERVVKLHRFHCVKVPVGAFNKKRRYLLQILYSAKFRCHLHYASVTESRSHGVTPRSRSSQVNALCCLLGVNSRRCHTFCEITHFAFEENFSLPFHHVADVADVADVTFQKGETIELKP